MATKQEAISKTENGTAGRKRMPFLIVFSVIVISIALFFVIRPFLSSPPKNVILIIIDTLRADHLGCYGYERKTTPNIDKLAQEGILFTNAISQAPWTLPSVGTMLTGQYPSTLGIFDKPARLNTKYPFLAELLKRNKYRTCGIVSNVLMSAKLGFGKGFDIYNEECSVAGHVGVSSPSVTKKAISFLRKNHEGPFFLMVHYFDPHYNFLLHPEYNFYSSYYGDLKSGEMIGTIWDKRHTMSEEDIKYLVSLHDSEVAFTDKYIGILLGEIERLGLNKNSMIILTADHGEEFMERGWIGHSISLYQELLHIPLIIKTPECKSQVVDSFVGLIDLTPTILHHLGIEIPLGLDGEVIDLNALELTTARPIFSETFNPQVHQAEEVAPIALRSVMLGSHKLIFDQKKGTYQLYDLTSDPYEQNDLSARASKQRKQLDALMAKYIEYVGEKGNSFAVPDSEKLFTPEQIEQLKSLGYM